MAKLKTGRHTSALKAARQAVVREVRNTSMLSSIRTAAKKVEAAVKIKDAANAAKFLTAAFSSWDKAVKTNVIKANAAANQKARLSRLVHSLSAQK